MYKCLNTRLLRYKFHHQGNYLKDRSFLLIVPQTLTKGRACAVASLHSHIIVFSIYKYIGYVKL